MSQGSQRRSLGEPSNPYSERRWRPIVWWEIAALQQQRDQPFAKLFVECLGEAVVSCRSLSMELKMQDIVQPIYEWQVLSVNYLDPADQQWGELGREITEWFSDGDSMTSDPPLAPTVGVESRTKVPAWMRSIPTFLGLF